VNYFLSVLESGHPAAAPDQLMQSSRKGPGAIASARGLLFFCALAERDPAAATSARRAGRHPWWSNESPIILSHSFGEGLLAG